MLFYISIFAILALLVMREYFTSCILTTSMAGISSYTVVFRYRASLVPFLPERVKLLFPALNNYTPLSFSDQLSAGLSSSNFDIESNIRDGDSRAGLDDRATQEIMEIMRRERVK